MSSRPLRYSVLALAMLGLAACSKKEEAPPPAATPDVAPAPPPAATVSTIETGKHLASNQRVTAVDSVFGPRDTLYVTVVSANSTPTSTLVAKWTFQTGQLVDSTSQIIARTDMANPEAVTAFHVVKPKGWPVGKYKVEVLLDGVSAGSREVVVKK